MNQPDEKTADVYLSCATADLPRADAVARHLGDAGLTVRRVSELDWQQAVAGDQLGDLWTFLRNSSALVVVGTRNHIRSPVLTMEVGAAISVQKPIYVLIDPDAADDLPSYLQRQQVLPRSELDHLAGLIAGRGLQSSAASR
jgi:hypothetical protein